MKKILLLIALFSPLTILAHEGHGIAGSGLIHLLVSHYYGVIGFVVVLIGVAYYRRKMKS